MIMTTTEMISRIKKMGFNITVDYNPSEEKIQHIKERLKLKEKYEKRIQEMSCIRQQLYAETGHRFVKGICSI